MIKRLSFAALLSALLMAAPAGAAEPLVDAAWVKANIANHNVVFLDLRGNPRAFQAAHIPGARFTSYGRHGWRATIKNVPGMLPPTAKLEALIGRLGIGNGDHVVLAPAGWNATEMGVATRIYWTFKVLGHDEVSILNGGMNAYMADTGNPLEKGMIQPGPKTFKAGFRPELLATAEDVSKAIAEKSAALIDNRPSGQYMGINKGGPVKRLGTLPGAKNVPAMWATVNDGGVFRSKQALEKMYKSIGLPTEGETINFCNTGHWASVGWFITHELLGNKKAKMYDGSMAEWSMTKSNPMDRRINLN
jgi:thiosulfate/3-mercaptopyruvate sulfurtransferase